MSLVVLIVLLIITLIVSIYVFPDNSIMPKTKFKSNVANAKNKISGGGIGLNPTLITVPETPVVEEPTNPQLERNKIDTNEELVSNVMFGKRPTDIQLNPEILSGVDGHLLRANINNERSISTTDVRGSRLIPLNTN